MSEDSAQSPKKATTHRFQFRLRTLMIATTLFCISSALFKFYYPVRHEREGGPLFTIAFCLLGASGGYLVARPMAEVVIGLLLGALTFLCFPELLVNSHRLR